MMNLYVVYDRLAEESGPVFEAKSDAVAVRAFNNMMAKSDAGTVGEFALFCMGSIDHGINKMLADETPRLVSVPQEA